MQSDTAADQPLESDRQSPAVSVGQTLHFNTPVTWKVVAYDPTRQAKRGEEGYAVLLSECGHEYVTSGTEVAQLTAAGPYRGCTEAWYTRGVAYMRSEAAMAAELGLAR